MDTVSKRAWLLVAAAVVVGTAWLLLRGDGSDGEPAPVVAAVERGPIRQVVSCTGRVVPSQEVEIKCKASGQVASILRDISDVVEKGKLLVELDPSDEERRVAQTEAAIAASRAQLDIRRNSLAVAERTLVTDRARAEAALVAAEAAAADARARAVRVGLLRQRNVASEEDQSAAETAAVQSETALKNARIRLEEIASQKLSLEGMRQQVQLAEAQVRADEITLADARQRLAETRVRSPITGVITSRNVEVGQIVSSAISNVGGGTTLLTVADLGRMFVLAGVDESDIGRIEVGQVTSVTVDAYPELTFDGVVRRIATKGVSASNVVTFEVKVEVTDEQRRFLKPEMTATVEVLVAQSGDALLVPSQAVTRTRKGYTVLVDNGTGTPEHRPVEVGVRNDTTVQITSGLVEGERVLLTSAGAESKWRRDGGRPPGPMMFGARPGGRR